MLVINVLAEFVFMVLGVCVSGMQEDCGSFLFSLFIYSEGCVSYPCVVLRKTCRCGVAIEVHACVDSSAVDQRCGGEVQVVLGLGFGCAVSDVPFMDKRKEGRGW